MSFCKNGSLTTSEIQCTSYQLPIEYKNLDYIECSGTQWINTNWITTTGMICEYIGMWTGTSTSYIVGSHAASDPYGRNGGYMDYKRSMWELGYGDMCPQNYNYERQLNKKYHARFSTLYDGAYLVVDGDLLLGTYYGQNTANVRVGVFHNYYSISPCGRCYDVRLWDSSKNLKFHFIPALRISDSKPGLYDEVSKTFFTNAGTGEFTYGGATSSPIQIYSSKIVVPEIMEY